MNKIFDVIFRLHIAKTSLDGGFKYILVFTPKIGEDEPILTFIFFKWVGSTTNRKLFVISVVLSLPFNLGAGLGAHCATGG